MKAFVKRMRVLLAAGTMALVCAVMPLLSQVLSGERAELTASAGTASVEAYHIKNITQEKEYVVNEKNFARLADTIVYFDSVWADKHDGGTKQNEWGAEVKVELENGKYVVKQIVADNVSKNMTIPEDGFVLSGNGTGKTALLEFEVGDEVEFIDNARFITVNQTKGLEVLVNAKNADPADCANVWTSAYGTETPSVSWRNRIICEKADGENLYTVTGMQGQDNGGAAQTATIPAGGIVIDTHSNAYTIQSGCFFASTAVGDTIKFEDTITLEPANMTAKSGDFELNIDGINPTVEMEFTGKSLIYTNTADGYKTLARTDETVKEYVVEKDGADWKVTDVKEEGETVIPDYDGFVLSVPYADGDDALKVGDTVTLDGAFTQNTAFAANVDSNKKVVITAANKKRDADQIILYDDAKYCCEETQEGFDEPEEGYTGTNPYGTEIKVEWDETEEKYLVTDKKVAGIDADCGNMQIPEDGFVLSGHGSGAFALDIFKVGDEVHVYDKTIESNNRLISLKAGGVSVEGFSPTVYNYNVIVDENETAAPVVTCAVQTRMGKTPEVKVNNIETARGTVTIEVTAPNGSVATYTVKFDREYSTDRRLASVTIGDVVLDEKDIQTNMTYAVKPGELPTVAATAKDPRATVTVTQATAANKEATIVVVADDTSMSPRTYTIKFVEADTSLASITVGGVALENFSANTLDYTHTLAAGTKEVPTVAATATDSKATVSVEQAESVTGKATITVTVDGISSTYTVQFEVASSNVGMIVGIVVGAVVVVAAAGVAVFFVIKKRGKNK